MDTTDKKIQTLATDNLAARARGYLPHLDGVRGISILLVVLSHAGLGHIIPGGLGVTIFFFISGFLITSLLRQEREVSGTVNLGYFYLRRLWRLYPALLMYTVIAMLFATSVGQRVGWEEPLFALFYLSNYYSLLHGYTTVLGTYSPFGILGTLAIEEHFYLLFAPLMLFVRSQRGIVAVLCSMLLVSLCIRLAVNAWVTPPEFAADYTYGATECRLDSIAYGCLLAVVNWRELTRSCAWGLAAGGVGLVLFTLVFRDAFFRETLRFSVQGLGLLLIFLPIIFSSYLGWVRQILSNVFLVYVGKLSYSIYLYHWLALIAVRHLLGDVRLSLDWQLPFWVLSCLFGVLSYYLVERPCMGVRRKYGSNV